MDKDEMELRPTPSWPMAVGGLATALVLVCGYLIWMQASSSPNEYSSLIEICSLVFSIISTTWFIVAVIRQSQQLEYQRREVNLQRNELSLQREQLSLQRFELERQADQFEISNQYNFTNTQIVVRKDIEESLFNYLQTDITRLARYGTGARRYAAEYMTKYTGELIIPDQIELIENDKDFYVKPNKETLTKLRKKFRSVENLTYIKIPIDQRKELEKHFRDEVIFELFSIARAHKVDTWFKAALPFTMRPVSGVTRDQISTVIRSNVE